jgi:hypothetical protein
MARKSLDDLAKQDFWTLPEFARLTFAKGRSWAYDKRRFRVDASGTEAWLRMPGGVDVPAHRDHNGRWAISRNQYELAKRRAEDGVREAG